MGTHVTRQDASAHLVTSLDDDDDDDGPPRVLITGELDMASAPVFGAHLAQLIGDRGPDVVIDVSSLTFCDAQGLAAFIAADELAHRRGGAVTLAGVRPQLAKILRITGLDRRFKGAQAATLGDGLSGPVSPADRDGRGG
ncbi:STAS domain-containing protein [Actinomadura soli]|uniref:STAS domain-containing protein n=1 Tax=Actinomadura soli TaxID=2508997 RepID=A0A5C4JGX9_9ACTN|nr:STAS domain-containing protein [Actinomadura soli]TMR04236.1 STAS domain-containing protein [Actinomadura soli]